MMTVGAEEIASVLGITKRGVNKKAAAEAWPCVEVTGNGGLRKEYPIAHLPADIQKALAKKEAAEAKKNLPARRGETLPAVVQSVEELKGWQRDVMTARTLVLRHLAKIEDELGGPAKAANELIRQAEEGILPAVIREALRTANARSGRNRTIDRTTLSGTYNEAGLFSGNRMISRILTTGSKTACQIVVGMWRIAFS